MQSVTAAANAAAAADFEPLDAEQTQFHHGADTTRGHVSSQEATPLLRKRKGYVLDTAKGHTFSQNSDQLARGSVAVVLVSHVVLLSHNLHGLHHHAQPTRP
jgi:hypothetical protein